jgi:hypothetical protein
MAFDYASICRFVSSMNFNLSGRVQTLLNISRWNQEILGSKIPTRPLLNGSRGQRCSVRGTALYRARRDGRNRVVTTAA